VNIHYRNLAECDGVAGCVVVIDVLRAFTTAAHAFHAGAARISLVDTIEAAFALRDRTQNSLLMGEERGVHIPGFDFENSPVEISTADLNGRALIQRTSAGTQGVVACRGVETLLAASFVCAAATARYLAQTWPSELTFIITGASARRDGEEDRAAAEYIAALVVGDQPNPEPFLARAMQSDAAQLFIDLGTPKATADLSACLRADTHDFAMPIAREAEELVIRPAASGSIR
jgi:2-phosphosulfolactate phosphatase